LCCRQGLAHLPFSTQVPDLSLAAFGLNPGPRPVAIVHCEGHFAGLDGKTAHGLVRHCDAFEIRAVVDGDCAGLDAGMVLDGVANGIPIVADLEEALARAPRACSVRGIVGPCRGRWPQVSTW